MDNTQDTGSAIVVTQKETLPHGQVVMFEQFGILRRTWWWVLIVAAIVTGSVWFYVANYVPVEYMATAVAVPPRKTGTPLDNLLGDISSGVKSLGLSRLIGKGAGSGGYSNMAVLTSRAIKDSLIAKYDLATTYDIDPKRTDLLYAAIDENMELDEDLEGPISISVFDTDPDRAAEIANDIVSFSNGMLMELNRQETEPISDFLEQRYNDMLEKQSEIGDRMAEFMRESNIYDPESQLPVTASALIDVRAQEGAQRSLVNVLSQVLGEDDPAVVQQKEVLRQLEKERKSLEGGGAGVGPSTGGLPDALLEYLKLRQEYEVNAQTLLLLEPMYQQTKYDENRDIPALMFLDRALPPPIKARPRKGLILISAFVGTIVLSYLLIAVIAYFRSFSNRYRQYRRSVDRDSVGR